MTLHNTTDDTFNFNEGLHHFHDPPSSIGPGEKIELRYDPGTPTSGNYWNTEGQIVVEVGSTSQRSKLWGEGAYRLQRQGWGEEGYDIIKG